jgi:hypothetical protein
MDCPKNPNAKQDYKRKYREREQLTTSQGRPIFSAYDVYRHYLKSNEWKRAA